MAASAAVLLCAPATAQNVASNAGVWWGGPVGGSAFTMFNPLTTVYGRIGALYSWRDNVTTQIPFIVPPTEFDTTRASGFGAMGGIGARLMPVLRAELQFSGELTHHAIYFVEGADLRARQSSAQILGNLFFDLAPLFGGALGGFNPYVFGGVGISFNTSSDVVRLGGLWFVGSGRTRADFAWNAGAGVQFQIMRHLIVDASYRYLDHGRYSTASASTAGGGFFWNATTTTNATAHQVMFSLIVPLDGLLRIP